ncbi:MAG: hypothetical protein ABEH64_11670, partial [Salinirussus sp.]
MVDAALLRAIMKISLPRELDEWVQSRADEIGVEPELIIQQIIDSHRTGNTAETVQPSQETGLNRVLLDSIIERKLEDWVDTELPEHLETQREAWVEEELSAHIDERIEDHQADWVDEDLPDLIDSRVEALLADRLEDELEDRLTAALEDREANLQDRLSALEDDQMEKIQDLRERVVQVKQETDQKASAEDLAATRERLEDLTVTLETTRDRVDEL